MNREISYASGALFVLFATLFMATWNWWLFPLTLLFQAGIFVPNFVVSYKEAKRRKE